MYPGRVDFYLIEHNTPDAKWLLACRLLEKAYQKGHHVFVMCNDVKDAEYLDELLWTFKDACFIPHNLSGEGPNPAPPIQIGYERAPESRDILMNLSNDVPAFFNQFKRILEIVSAEEDAKAISRNHYQYYRKAGWALNTHTMTA